MLPTLSKKEKKFLGRQDFFMAIMPSGFFYSRHERRKKNMRTCGGNKQHDIRLTERERGREAERERQRERETETVMTLRRPYRKWRKRRKRTTSIGITRKAKKTTESMKWMTSQPPTEKRERARSKSQVRRPDLERTSRRRKKEKGLFAQKLSSINKIAS